MLRVSVHSGPPSEASRFNRTDWIDIGYQKLDARAEYKIVLVENGVGARESVFLNSYPRWSASLWDLAARALALALFTARPATKARVGTEPSAKDASGEAIQIEDVTPGPSVRPPPARVEAIDVRVPRAELVGRKCAFADMTTALITHYPSTGVGGRRLGTMVIAQHRKRRGNYGMSVQEDPLARKIIPPFYFMPSRLRPAELVLRACLNMLSGDIDRMPDCPTIHLPKTDIIRGETFVPIHRLDEPARTGFLRWLHATQRTPKPARGASLGRVPAKLYVEFLCTAV